MMKEEEKKVKEEKKNLFLFNSVFAKFIWL